MLPIRFRGVESAEDHLQPIQHASIQWGCPSIVLVVQRVALVILEHGDDRQADQAHQHSERNASNDGHSPQRRQGIIPSGEEQRASEAALREGPVDFGDRVCLLTVTCDQVHNQRSTVGRRHKVNDDGENAEARQKGAKPGIVVHQVEPNVVSCLRREHADGAQSRVRVVRSIRPRWAHLRSALRRCAGAHDALRDMPALGSGLAFFRSDPAVGEIVWHNTQVLVVVGWNELQRIQSLRVATLRVSVRERRLDELPFPVHLNACTAEAREPDEAIDHRHRKCEIDDLRHSPALRDFRQEHANERRPRNPPAPIEDRPPIHPRRVRALTLDVTAASKPELREGVGEPPQLQDPLEVHTEGLHHHVQEIPGVVERHRAGPQEHATAERDLGQKLDTRLQPGQHGAGGNQGDDQRAARSRRSRK